MLASCFISYTLALHFRFMNLFDPPKYIKGIHIRFGENPFVLLSLFACQAMKQKWQQKEIKNVIDNAKAGDYKHLVNSLKAHCH